MNEVEVTPTSDVPRNKRASRAGDCGFKVRVVTPGWMQKHDDTDYYVIVVAKDKFGRSQNGALDQGVKST